MAEQRYPRGTELRSAKWGICVLDRPSYMRPGTKVCVRNRSTSVGPQWRLVEDFERPPASGVGGKTK